jgi:hypothetical protein
MHPMIVAVISKLLDAFAIAIEDSSTAPLVMQCWECIIAKSDAPQLVDCSAAVLRVAGGLLCSAECSFHNATHVTARWRPLHWVQESDGRPIFGF